MANQNPGGQGNCAQSGALCTQAHTHVHGCVHRCIQMHVRVYIHASSAHTGMYTWMAQSRSTIPVDDFFVLFLFVFLSFMRTIIQNVKNHSLRGPRWMGGAAQQPQEMISTLQGPAILWNHDPGPLLATDLYSGCKAVSATIRWNED